jgi:hypothetical protein
MISMGTTSRGGAAEGILYLIGTWSVVVQSRALFSLGERPLTAQNDRYWQGTPQDLSSKPLEFENG